MLARSLIHNSPTFCSSNNSKTSYTVCQLFGGDSRGRTNKVILFIIPNSQTSRKASTLMFRFVRTIKVKLVSVCEEKNCPDRTICKYSPKHQRLMILNLIRKLARSLIQNTYGSTVQIIAKHHICWLFGEDKHSFFHFLFNKFTKLSEQHLQWC